jgi:hypothetical protein
VLQVWGNEQSPERSGLRDLRVERQLNAAVNLYLQMEGLPHDPELFDKVVGWFALTGEEADEGSNESWRSPRLMNPKSYVSLPKTHSSEPS